MIRADLRVLINRHKLIERLNNNNNNIDNTDTSNNNNDNTDANNNNNDNNNNNNNNYDTDLEEGKIMLRMYSKCISTKRFNETCSMHPKSKQVEVYMENRYYNN